MFTKHRTEQEIKNLISMCRRQGPHYTAQTVLWEIDEVLKKSKYIPFTISLLKLRNKIINTDTEKTSLKDVYKDILDIIALSKISNEEILNLKNLIEALLKSEI